MELFGSMHENITEIHLRFTGKKAQIRSRISSSLAISKRLPFLLPKRSGSKYQMPTRLDSRRLPNISAEKAYCIIMVSNANTLLIVRALC